MVKRNKIYAMKLKLRENLFFELKIQFKNHSIYVVKLPQFPPGMGVKILETGDPGTGDLRTGIFSLTQGFETLQISEYATCHKKANNSF